MPYVGRGKHYSTLRKTIEKTLDFVYRGNWPAELLRVAGLQPRVRTVHHRVVARHWPHGARPLRIAFLSDLHAGPTTHPSLIREAIDAVAAARPDVILLGGDYVFLDTRAMGALAAELARLRAPFGKFAVFGNHDLWTDYRAIEGALDGAGFRCLVNENVRLPPPYAHVSVVGLDEPWTGSVDAERAFRGAEDVRILLMHAPDGLALLGSQRFDLALAGHTHGGHIALPGGIPIVAFGPLSRVYSHGEHRVLEATLIVSRGVGATESALRLFADPDVRIVTIAGSGISEMPAPS